MGKPKRVYSESFKEKAVSLSYQRENIKELADELGIQVQRIYKWRATSRKEVSLKSITNSMGIHQKSYQFDLRFGSLLL